jgi:hypothetical protein
MDMESIQETMAGVVMVVFCQWILYYVDYTALCSDTLIP